MSEDNRQTPAGVPTFLTEEKGPTVEDLLQKYHVVNKAKADQVALAAKLLAELEKVRNNISHLADEVRLVRLDYEIALEQASKDALAGK